MAGRPPREKEASTIVFTLRLTTEEDRTLRAAAAAADSSVSAYVRAKLFTAPSPKPKVQASPPKAPPTRLQLLLDLAHELTDERLGLVPVPALVRALREQHSLPTDAAHALLREASRAGLLELRPESGMGRISKADKVLCPAGPQGSVLSWARVI